MEFKALTIKTETDDIYTIFLLKKNVRSDIIKIKLGYLPIATPELLKRWKMAVISVKQEYKSTEGKQDYRTKSEITYGRREVPIDIGKFRDNYDKDEKSKYFNCNVYRQRIAESQRKRKKLENITNVTK